MDEIEFKVECPECGGLAELEDSCVRKRLYGGYVPVWAEYVCPECGHRFTVDFCIDYDFEEM